MDQATKISRNGFDAEVVMKVMTCQFGPNGFFRTVPTPRKQMPITADDIVAKFSTLTSGEALARPRLEPLKDSERR